MRMVSRWREKFDAALGAQGGIIAQGAVVAALDGS
jgi:hypothetical protein